MNDKPLLEQVFLQALSETFESLFFEEVVIQSIQTAETLPELSDCWWAKIEIFEPMQSSLIFFVRKELMIQFTEAVFGMLEDEMPAENQVLDNLGELMNTLSGRIMAMLIPPQQGFSLGLPIVGEGQLPDCKGEFVAVNCLIGDNLVFLYVPTNFWNHDFVLI